MRGTWALPLVGVADFRLPDQHGREFHFRARLDRAFVLVFVRGHWCPYCRRYLAKLQRNLAHFAERGAGLAAISPEPTATSARLAGELGLTYPILSDSSGKVIEQFGVRNEFSSVHAMLPHASAFVLDRFGVIRFRSIDRNYKRRTTMSAIFAALDGLRDRPAEKMSDSISD